MHHSPDSKGEHGWNILPYRYEQWWNGVGTSRDSNDLGEHGALLQVSQNLRNVASMLPRSNVDNFINPTFEKCAVLPFCAGRCSGEAVVKLPRNASVRIHIQPAEQKRLRTP